MLKKTQQAKEPKPKSKAKQNKTTLHHGQHSLSIKEVQMKG